MPVVQLVDRRAQGLRLPLRPRRAARAAARARHPDRRQRQRGPQPARDRLGASATSASTGRTVSTRPRARSLTERPAEAPALRNHRDFALAVPTPDHFIPLLLHRRPRRGGEAERERARRRLRLRFAVDDGLHARCTVRDRRRRSPSERESAQSARRPGRRHERVTVTRRSDTARPARTAARARRLRAPGTPPDRARRPSAPSPAAHTRSSAHRR